jgi:hypothetical protein
MTKNKQAKRIAKKAERKLMSRSDRKSYSKKRQDLRVEVGVAKIAEALGMDDARDRAVLRVASRRAEGRKKQNLERLAAASFNLPSEVKRNILSFIGVSKGIAVPPIPKRR